ncbi:hypothetical protein RAS1_11310 [Phycisphaerae bacterium RAS1]|nr:hypothetical protein RAS1_11310 [Phycisphaerae bacterium RAS1]
MKMTSSASHYGFREASACRRGAGRHGQLAACVALAGKPPVAPGASRSEGGSGVTARGLRSAIVVVLGLACGTVLAGEREIAGNIKSFFDTADPLRREQLARQIESDTAYKREKIGQWLHRAELFPKRQPGRDTLKVELAGGATREVVLRLPAKYSEKKPWPLIYALHGTGADGDSIIHYLEAVLGPHVDDFVIAAPTAYDQVVIATDGPPSDEHPRAWLAIRKAVHTDADRMYITGYSRGGHASWTLAVLHADQIAAAMPIAGTFHLIGVDQLWDAFLPNIGNAHILHVWGARDELDDGGDASPHGGIAGVSRKLREHCEKLKLPLTAYEDPQRGHGNVLPPAEILTAFFENRREAYPKHVVQACRWAYQSNAYWLEGHAWKGEHWENKQFNVTIREGETGEEAYHREIRSRLGELSGGIDGQTISVHRKKITELTIWIGDGMIDWSAPAKLVISGKREFAGTIEPDLLVCLTQAARTFDFERLRWAGFRYRSGKKLERVTGATEFPPVRDEAR